MKTTPMYKQSFLVLSKISQLLLVMVIVLLANPVYAQDLSKNAQRQLKSLMQEKASRTAVQRKINSQIWYAYKMDSGMMIAPEVASLRTGVKKDARGLIKTEISAELTPELLRSLVRQECEIIQSHEKYGKIIAMIPLARVELIAELSEILYINLWIDPALTSSFSDERLNSEIGVSKGKNVSIPKNSKADKERNMDFESDSESSVSENLNTTVSSALIGAVTSHGDVKHQTSLLRSNYDIDGSGIKIGVLSDSYDTSPTGSNAIDDIFSGDLPGPGNPNGYTTPVTVLSDLAGGSDEGRAMLQIIHDIAPGAELYFASGFNGELDFAQQVLDLHAAGCDIIVDDVAYFFENVWGDGPITDAINTVTTDGVLYFSSTGNSGNLNDGTSGVWEGDFQDGGTLPLFPGGTLHDFGGGLLYNTITEAGGSNVLTWSDVFDASTNDYDMFMTDASGTNIVAAGTETSMIALEYVPAGNIGERIYILKTDGAQTRALRLANNQGELSVGTQGSTFGHNAAENTISVAATYANPNIPGIFNAGNQVEAFSSDGPRRKFYNPDESEITPGNLLFGTNGGVVLQKPDITAADGVITSVEGFNPFFGTSASSPHAAAIAALVQEALPTYSSTQVRDLLFNTAIDIEAPGVDRDAGQGIIMPLKAVESLGFSLISSEIVEANSSFNNFNTIVEPGEIGNVHFHLKKNIAFAPTNIKITITSNTPGVTVTTGELNFPAAFADIDVQANQIQFATNRDMDCSALINFTITLTYDGSALTKQTFQVQPYTLGQAAPALTGTLGTTPPVGVYSTSFSGTTTGRVVACDANGQNQTTLVKSTCDSGPSPNLCIFAAGFQFPYHAYTFTNQNETDSTCILVNWAVPNQSPNTPVTFLAYNAAGLIPGQSNLNILGHASFFGTNPSNNFSFKVAAGEEYTVVVVQNSSISSGGTGMSYSIQVTQEQCLEIPCTANDQIVLSPAAHVLGVDKFTGTAGLPFSQSFSTTGGSGFELFSPIGEIPGLTLTQNNGIGTLSGIPTGPFGTPPNGDLWGLVASDAIGCAPFDLNFYYVEIDPCTPVSIVNALTSNSPICAGETLELSISPSGQGPFTYEWSGPGGTFVNEETGTPSVLNPVNGIYAVTVTNYCGSMESAHLIELNTPPVVNVSGAYNLTADDGLCTATSNGSQLFSLVSATGTPTPTISIPLSESYPVGLTIETATAVNICGSDTETIDVIVSDVGPPTVLCKNIDIEVTNGSTNLLAEDIDAGSFDDCDFDLLVDGVSGGNIIDTQIEGVQIVTLTAIDLSGNQATCDAEVNVIKDLCPEGDDAVDSDGGGLPDACDCSPNDAFNDNIILEQGISNAMDFDGVNDQLTIPNQGELIPTNINSMTFEAWIKPNTVSGFQSIVSSANNLSVYNLAIYLLNDKLRVTATGGSLVLSNASIPVNAWTHVAVVFASNPNTPALSKIEIFINGELDNSLTGSFESSNLGNPIIIGDINGADWIYDGQMDEVRIWSNTRTIDQIQLLKDRELSGKESSLSAYYDFSDGIPAGDNTGAAVVEDISDNDFDATLTGFTQSGIASNWINGELSIDRFYREPLVPCINCPERIALNFDGNGDLVTIPNHPDLVPTNGNSMTFEAWVNPDLGAGNKCLVSSANSLSVYNLAVYMVSGNKIRVTAKGGQLVTSNAGIPVAQWSHVAVVFTANANNPALSKIEIYINGQLDAMLMDDFESTNLGNPIIMGNINGADWSFDGDMDDVRFWSEARSSAEILGNMNTELFGDEQYLAAYYNFNYGIPNGDNTALTSVTDQTVRQLHATLSGFAQTGFASNWIGDATSSAPIQNAALNFDGVDDYLSIPYKDELIATSTNSVTVEAWIYPEKASGVNMIYSSGVFPTLDHQIFLDGTLLLVTGNGLGGLVANASVPISTWTHIAVVFDKTETRLYINGTLDNTRVQTLAANAQGWDTTFGSQNDGLPQSWNFFGEMDDIRIWNSARTAEEIFANILQEQNGREEGMEAYFNANDGVPESNNASIISLNDFSGNGNSALMNGFAKTGTTSNWVTSPFRLSDRDMDGLPDFCDNCIRLQNLLLQNMALDGVHDAMEKITLGEGLNFSNTANITLRAPLTEVPQQVELPAGVTIKLIPMSCEDE